MSLINVYHMAEAREYRKKKQEELVRKNNYPLISFTLNIPGPEKNSPLYRKIHEEGMSAIKVALASEIVNIISRDEATGCEAYITLNLPADKIKKRTIEIEENHILGRIFDIDVIDTENQSVSRRSLNYPPRKCLICNEEAALCSRSRKHSVNELIAEIKLISRNL